MKTINDVLLLINQAIQNNQATCDEELRPQWFVSYSGHVNKISVTYYRNGWSVEKADKGLFDECEINPSNDNKVQELYWFMKNRL
jgi:hypothetical protein